MSDLKEPFLVEPGWEKMIFISAFGEASSFRVLFYKDGNKRFEHRCVSDTEDSIICAPSLSKHTIEQEEPLTISPSILCPRCNLHGFIREGRWVSA